MKEYVYYACGRYVESIKFNTAKEAWEYVIQHAGYDCVVERRAQYLSTLQQHLRKENTFTLHYNTKC